MKEVYDPGAKMRVLIACEFSGVVRDAFIARGHDAMSCDILPSEREGPHFQGDVRPWLEKPWDLVIAHPPCTYLCNSGARWLSRPGRLDLVRQAREFFMLCLAANSPRVCVENPIMHGTGREGVPSFTQIIQPWMFGHPETKRSCLWLRGLPPLEPTQVVAGRAPKSWLAPDSKDRWKNRSRTHEGIAKGMAAQWGR